MEQISLTHTISGKPQKKLIMSHTQVWVLIITLPHNININE